MKLGMIGLGRMGANMAQRLLHGGHPVVGFDPRIEARVALQGQGAETVDSLVALVAKLPPPRALWLMVPAGEVTDAILDGLRPLLQAGDTLVDGGNSRYQDSQRRAASFAGQGIGYVDCGTSGGVWGLAEGYSLMIGGDEAVVERLSPLFECLAPAPGRGWGRVGPAGAGHFAKMVHNGIEYGLMQAYAEGFSILRQKHDFDLDLQQLADIWSHGSVVRSWLLELTAKALAEHPSLHDITPYVADSGEGRWTVDEAIALGVPAPVITQALIARLRSRDAESFADRLLAALRNQFGGHEVRKE
ncbi:6-phosphogluconate dehydrogenase [Pseudomonas citronellolis]|uniref:6-phosphogluconate dehydrogenase n=1 Tax=Pseudomonas citronellolis TaxID=53408 RepID=A0AAQ1HN96_9PSED|nr:MULTISPECIES: decarboxylating 6-phosphogluconate dehydrogenase [Pseudomonas]MBG4910276.1 decarboxylating 6-phosphogluconate dehydrogenase [Pseudomonas aeruginosa]KWR75247.1 6-phosphogluconate dehydrogenase [Pseudomonas sp. PI1]TGC30865.1 6-phosphogluconate dehydrogenase (decarboxylating) [Pseudomonas citronellolis]UUC52311.1 decarboxylating 6-phosphogluconate dehydrogenase [Pseudomonas citronellolis]SFC85772.1 6-phosphogluconate dehydrogenase [Pseudomonas citronellolis]